MELSGVKRIQMGIGVSSLDDNTVGAAGTGSGGTQNDNSILSTTAYHR